MKHLFFSKFLVFIAVICVAFKAFSIGAFVVPVSLDKTVASQHINKINNSNNYSLFQSQTNESNLFDIDKEEIEEDLDGDDDDHLIVDINLNQKHYLHFQVAQKSESHAATIRKKIFAESIPIFIQFRNFRL